LHNPPSAIPALSLPAHWSARIGQGERVLRERLETLSEGACDILMLVDAENRLVGASRTTRNTVDILADTLEGLALEDIVVEDDWPLVAKVLRGTRLTEAPRKVQARLRAAAYRWMEFTVLPCATDGQEFALFLCGRDVTDVKSAEAALEYQATHDALTGRPNRIALELHLQDEIMASRRGQRTFALFVLGLDGLHKANHGMGHAAGDTVLKDTAQRLQELVGDAGFVARLCGDEFAVTLPHVAQAAEVDSFVSKALAAIQRPFVLGEHTLFLTASIGVAVFPANGETNSALLSNANIAMQQAKALGRDRSCVFIDQMRTTSAHTHALEAALHEGVRNGEFLLHYQPICDAASSRMVGVEALMRWSRPRCGLVSPGEFIPIVEANGLINVLGAWALRSATMQLAQWDANGLPGLYVSVNVSPRQFKNPQFIGEVRKVLELSQLDPSRLVLEITEGTLMVDPESSRTTLARLVEMGLQISIDDFGTGYSSLAYLQKFPLHTLKIDRSFVQNLATNRHDVAIVSAILAMAREIGLKVVAEGVEQEEQRAILAAKGCGFVQGWLTGRPQPAKALTPALPQHPSAQAA
jgi:diguanylate cyclase (GGDEF)-like protein/PAS domain S-box-containing protein